MRTDTAYMDWDRRWSTEEGRAAWSIPEPAVVAVVEGMKVRIPVRVLDLGSGPGRHALLMAEAGLETWAMDGSPAGLEHLANRAQERSLTIQTVEGFMTELPFDPGFFDYVLAWNVVYHGDIGVMHRAMSEIHRVLKPHGVFQGTFLSKRNSETRIGRCISRDTLINDGLSDKAHPHCYTSFADLAHVLHGFEPLEISDHEHQRPGSFHWHVIAEKPVD